MRPILAATRAMLGAGAGVLASRWMPRRRNRALGWTLLGVGVASVPLVTMALRRR